jgi:SAM-dependent methyltransferase
MRHEDAVALLEAAALDRWTPSSWADLGCGDGTFTRALAELIAPGSIIHAIDRDAAALARVPSVVGSVRIDKHVGDFTWSWPFVTVLDGVLMANAMHYVRDQPAFLRSCLPQVSVAGRFLIVEYDTAIANPWVPYPINRARLAELFSQIGDVTMLGTRRSTYGRARLYAAIVTRRAAVTS